MPDILHDLTIGAPPDKVFAAVSRPAGLDSWWTLKSAGEVAEGATFELDFGPEYHWQARVIACEQNSKFELEITRAADDWMGTRVAFELQETPQGTRLQFRHSGWPEASEHFRVSAFCWATYLRLLRKYVETGDVVPYADRDQA